MLWLAAQPELLDEPAREEISKLSNTVAFSASSIWEISIKRTLGKLTVPSDLVGLLVERRYAPLSVTVEHALAAGALPLHHSDPFDRMLVAQAQLEGMTLVTRDRRLAAYDVVVLPA